MNAALTTIGTVAIALVLGVLGPAIDAQPDRRHEYPAADLALREPGLVRSWELDAQERCARQGGPNAGYIRLDKGGIICTDKRGRRMVAKKERP